MLSMSANQRTLTLVGSTSVARATCDGSAAVLGRGHVMGWLPGVTTRIAPPSSHVLATTRPRKLSRLASGMDTGGSTAKRRPLEAGHALTADPCGAFDAIVAEGADNAAVGRPSAEAGKPVEHALASNAAAKIRR